MADAVEGQANPLVLNRKSQASLVKYVSSVLESKRKFTQFTDKLTAIDVAYACYQATLKANQQPTDGIDLAKAHPADTTTIGVIASQVDSVVAYLMEVFLDGYPMFPVISPARDTELSEKFEAIVASHAHKGRYARHFQIMFRDVAKYNFCGMVSRWGSMAEFSSALAATFAEGNKPTLATRQMLTTVKRLDPYNAIWDYRVSPADVASDGEYGGYVEMLSRVALKRLLNAYSETSDHMNVTTALSSRVGGDISNRDANANIATQGKPITYVEKPQISAYINSEAYQNGGTWLEYFGASTQLPANIPTYSNMYEVATIYARIIPSEHGIVAPRANTPQIWRLQVVNESVLIHARPEATPHDMLPTVFGQAIEDGFSYQTRGIGEAQIPFQTAMTDLFRVRLNGSKRALNDRGLYDSDLINMADINSPVAAAKIPVRNLKLGKTLRDAYMPIPFQDGSTTSASQDMQQTLQMSNMLFGINAFKQGQPMKGNRTLGEYSDVADNADSRSRLLALMLELQIFQPLKDVIKLNIISNKDRIEALNFNTGESYSVDPAEFINAVIEFKVADGFTPKSKLASTQQLTMAFQILQQDPNLAQGFNMPDLFSHLMSLAGVKNLSQYKLSEDDKRLIIQKAMPYLPEMLQMAQQAQGGGQDSQAQQGQGLA